MFERGLIMAGKVYVVHCIDTEGPLYEAPTVPFEQLKKIYGIEIEPTRENLLKLQKGEIDVGEQEDAIKNLLDIHKISTKGTWEEIDQTLKKITSDEYRTILPDSHGNGWIYSWFCMDHVGFWGDNPRRRDEGHHKVFDRYRRMVNEQKMGDIVQFHHHPVSLSGNFNDSGTAYWGSSNLNQILARKIIDRQWFPSVYRPGFHTERPDANWFLEQWIPFDYGNQAVKEDDTQQLDLSQGRFGDWRHAPVEWVPYHPAHDDYQEKGSCRRWITRCLNMHARIRELTKAEVESAFEQAKNGVDVILAFTDHDYKDMEYEIEKTRNLIKDVSEEYSDVEFLYKDALSAMRECLHLQEKSLNLNLELVDDFQYKKLFVRAESDIFGPQPFLALKDKNGEYHWDNFDFVEKNVWSYTFDTNTILYAKVDKIGVAANNACGYAAVEILENM